MQYINYRESRQRGTADFPIEYHHVSPTHPQYIMALHWHVEFELIRILSGSLKLTVDEEEYTAKAGSSCFIPAGTIHAGEPDNTRWNCRIISRIPAPGSTGSSGPSSTLPPPKTRDTSLLSSAQCISSLVRFSPHMITSRFRKNRRAHTAGSCSLNRRWSLWSPPITSRSHWKRWPKASVCPPNISADFFTR